jgi:hypothetical protein
MLEQSPRIYSEELIRNQRERAFCTSFAGLVSGLESTHARRSHFFPALIFNAGECGEKKFSRIS